MKDFLTKLVQIDTTASKGELPAARLVAEELALSGINAEIDSWDRTRANVSARIPSEGERRPLLFACHLDVVGPGAEPWEHPPFSGLQRDGRVYGRGATDMKGGIAAIVEAVRQIADSGVRLLGDILFVATAGEETDSCGATRFLEGCSASGEYAGVIVPEPTDFEIVTAHRGMLWLQIATKGVTAHGSNPNLGVNAINSARTLLNELQTYAPKAEPHELLGGCSMSINTIAAGNEINVVPDKCTIGIDFRTLPGQNHADILADLEEIFRRLKAADPKFDAEIKIVRQVKPLETDSGSAFVRKFCNTLGAAQTKAVGFTTDGPYFAQLAAPVVIFGPGKGEICHKPNEYIQISDVEKAADRYKQIILAFLT